MNLHFVTSNPNKFRELSELLEFNLSRVEHDLQEIQTTDLHELVKFFLKNIGLSGMVRALDEFKNNSASAACCLGFTKDGKSIHLFEGKVKGNIVEPRGSQHFGWDAIFLPAGYQRTFGEISSQEKHQISPRGVAVKKFKDFLTLQARQK